MRRIALLAFELVGLAAAGDQPTTDAQKLDRARHQITLLRAELENSQRQLAAARAELVAAQKRAEYQAFVEEQKRTAKKDAGCDLTTEQEWTCPTAPAPPTDKK